MTSPQYKVIRCLFYLIINKQGLTHRSATLLLRVPLVFPPFGWKKLKAKSRQALTLFTSII